MSRSYIITHYYHSGFSIAADDLLFVFDYWRGEHGELTPDKQLTEEKLSAFRKIIVCISHEHMDHLDPIVFTWKDKFPVSYIVSSDMPVGTRGKRMAPGDILSIEEGVTLRAFGSTDLGISFLLELYGTTFFHAGDLNFWHWQEESTLKEIEEAEVEFRNEVKPLESETVDVAFFPLDPRQGNMFEAGTNYFIFAVKPRLLIPMHYFRRWEIIREFARTAAFRETEVLAMTDVGSVICLECGDEGYLDVSFPKPEEEEEEEKLPLEEVIENNPFAESDLPLDQLASGFEKKEPENDEQSPENPE